MKTRISNLIITILFALLLGTSIVQGWMILGFVSIAVIYLLEKHLIAQKYRTYFEFLMTFTAASFLATTWWFTRITASGWTSNIWLFSPTKWLGFVLIVVTLFISLLAITPKLLLKRYVTGNLPWYIYPIAWSLCMMTAELLLSSSMSLLTRGNGVPLMPTWNFFSVSLLIPPQSVFGGISETLGLWGTSFMVYLTISFFIETVVIIAQKRKTRLRYLNLLPVTIVAFLIIVLCVIPFVRESSNNKEEVKIVAISTKGNNNYLQELIPYLKTTNDTLIVLPEYSALLRPYPGGIMETGDKDYRDVYKNNLKNSSTYIVGTDDNYIDGKRIVETFLVNDTLSVLKTKQKTFLVPGGEYIIPWVNSLIERVDKNSASSFAEQKGRYVFNKRNELQTSDRFVNKIGIGACSTILIPYDYRNQVKTGAQILTSNVSYTQFDNAPEYEQYAHKFAAFNARSLSKPFVISAFNGSALVIQSNGSILKQTNKGVLHTPISFDETRTIYARLGDRNIILILYALYGLIISASMFNRKKNL